MQFSRFFVIGLLFFPLQAMSQRFEEKEPPGAGQLDGGMTPSHGGSGVFELTEVGMRIQWVLTPEIHNQDKDKELEDHRVSVGQPSPGRGVPLFSSTNPPSSSSEDHSSQNDGGK